MGGRTGTEISVLVVEDDPDLLEILAEHLEREDDRFSVYTAPAARAGETLLAEIPIDCIIADYALPGENGLDFLETVRASHPDLPFILYTGKGSESVASEAMKAGVTDYFVKGTSTEQYTRLANRVVNAVEHRRAQEQLTAAEERYRTLFEELNEGAVLCELCRDETGDPVDYEIIDANAAVEELFDVSKSAIVGERVTALLGTEEPPNLDRLAAVIETGESVRFETSIPGFDHHFRVSAFSPRPGQVAAIFADITDRIERERDLERFEKATESAGHAIYVTDRDGTIEYANPAFEEMTGYDREAALGANPRILKSGEMDRAYYADLWETILDGAVWEEEIINRKQGGELYYANQTIAPIYDETGEIEEFVAIQTDISDQKAHEANLELFQKLIDESSDLITVADAETGEITYANRTAADRLGYSRAELESLQVPDIEASFDTVEEWATHVETVRERGQLRFEGIQVRKDGETIPVEVNLTTVDLETEYVVAIARDVTERLEYERELELRNERLDEFASVVSHDLRNPLNVARGRIELARETGETTHLEAAQSATDRSLDLVGDMLSLARAGKRVQQLEVVDLGDLCRTGWEHVETSEATLAVDVDGRIRADRSRLEQLLENLLRNAIDHGGPSVTITVGSLSDGFFVADDGPGIPESDRENVFEAGHSTREDGTGFGLSIVQEIAEAHDWEIAITDSESGGARFEITGVEWAE
ncbi:MAG: PAS domain S-box protein [Halodesulfurarchaeum sp.]|nr:PAS domain S-box protein [Halodesulfurarchaeum sp.]